MVASRAGKEMLDVSGGARDVLRRLQHSELDEAMTALSTALAAEPTVFCHGDIRSTNVLVAPTGNFDIELIDWELSGGGPAAWDVGAGLAIFIEIALVAGDGTPSSRVVQAFVAGHGAAAAGSALLLIVQCAGARLLHAAFESGMGTSQLTPHSERLITIGSLFVRRPHEGAIHLGLVT
jgi:aminoglycoside phosphotransferase (APT) family kinase protein